MKSIIEREVSTINQVLWLKIIAVFAILHLFCLLYTLTKGSDCFVSFLSVFFVLLINSILILLAVTIMQKGYSLAMILIVLLEIGAMFQCIIEPSSCTSLAASCVVGSIAGVAFVWFHCTVYKKQWVKKLYPCACLVLFVIANFVLLLFGIEAEGTNIKLWVMIGPMSVQVTDVMKLLLIMYYAHMFAIQDMDEKKKFIIMEIVLAVSIVCFMRHSEMGTLLVLVFTYTIACFLFMNKRYALINLVIEVSLFIVACLAIFIIVNVLNGQGPGGIYGIAQKLYDRFLTVVNPMKGLQTYSFQVITGKKYMLAGGLTGNNLAIINLPNAANDLAIMGLFFKCGSLMGLIVISLYAFCGILGAYKISKRSDITSMHQYLNIIFIIAFVFQAFYSTLACFNYLPLTGIPFPFLSVGGSAQVIFIIYFFSMIFLDGSY